MGEKFIPPQRSGWREAQERDRKLKYILSVRHQFLIIFFELAFINNFLCYNYIKFTLSMSSQFKLNSYLTDRPKRDELHIGKNEIRATFSAFKYQDKDTNQFVIYIPSIELSAYGETKIKAENMMRSSLQEYCKFLMSLSPKGIAAELTKLGWSKDRLKNKDFSKSYVDVTGELKDFAINEVVEQESLVAH